MKEVRLKQDKAGSRIIATILLITIAVVVAATLVTKLGWLTQGAGNTVEVAGVNTTASSNGTIIAKVSSSSQVLANSQITYKLTLNGTFVYTGLLSNHYDNNVTNGAVVYIEQSSNYFAKGTIYEFYVHQKGAVGGIVSTYKLTLNYKGNLFYNSFTHTTNINTGEFFSAYFHITMNDIYINVTSASIPINASYIIVSIRGASFNVTGSDILAIVAHVSRNSDNATFTGGSSYIIPIHGTISPSSVSFELIYRGNVIYSSEN